MSKPPPFVLAPPRRNRAKEQANLPPGEFARQMEEALKYCLEYDPLPLAIKDRYIEIRTAYQDYARRFHEDKHQCIIPDGGLPDICWPVHHGECDFSTFTELLIGFICYTGERDCQISGKTYQPYIESMLYWSRKEYNLKRIMTPDEMSLRHSMETAVRETLHRLAHKDENVDVSPQSGKEKM